MSYFDDLLSKRGISRFEDTLEYLWQLKLSDAEFEELRALLGKVISIQSPSWFRCHNRECTLYFAEYWKRYFDGGAHNVKSVVGSLAAGLGDNSEYVNAFYESAKQGAEKLNIKIYRNEDRLQRILDSILYQGGLPMRLICQTERDGVQSWQLFVRRLVKGYIDLNDEQLGLGKAATTLSSIRKFANQLYIGISTNDPDQMPFDCGSIEHPWFDSLTKIKESERKRTHEEMPFVINWQIEIDDRRHQGRILGQVVVPSRLSKKFIDEHCDCEQLSATARILVDGEVCRSIEYQRGYTRMSRSILIPIVNDDTMVSVDFEDNSLISTYFDFDRPQLFVSQQRQPNGWLKGEKTNHLHDGEMFIYVPHGWTYSDIADASAMECYIAGNRATIITVSNCSEDITLTGPDAQSMVVSSHNVVSETQMLYSPLYSDLVLSPMLCNASSLKNCWMVTETPDGLTRQLRPLEYECGANKWCAHAPYGKVKARAKGVADEQCDAATICNVGNDFAIEIIKADANKARIRICWNHGQVTCLEPNAELCTDDNSWTVSRNSLPNPAVVRFRLTTQGHQNKPFDIKMRAPFRQAEIRDECGEPVAGRVYVPLCDYDKFSYTIFGYDNGVFNVDNDRYRLTGNGNKFIVKNRDDITRSTNHEVARHGSIAALFGSMSAMRQRLDTQSGTVVTANVKSLLQIAGRNDIELNVSEMPFKLHYSADDFTFYLTDPEGRPRSFKHALLAFRLSEPKTAPLEIKANTDGLLQMPEELRDVADILIVGKVPGRVCSRLFNKSDNEHSRNQLIDSISAQLLGSKIDSEAWKSAFDWFDTASEYGMHYSNLLQLEAITNHSDTLTAFLFGSLVRTYDNNLSELTGRLMQLSRDLHFKWFWLLPALQNGIMNSLEKFIDLDSESMVRMLAPRAIATLQIDILNELAPSLLMNKIGELEDFIIDLIKRSFDDTSMPIEPYIREYANSWLSNESKKYRIEDKRSQFFNLSVDTTTQYPDLEDIDVKCDSPNDRWLELRARAFANHVKKPSNAKSLFAMTSDTRRSLCLCYDKEPEQFIIRAHNAMLAH